MDLIKGYSNTVKFPVPVDLDDADFTVTYGETTTTSAPADVVEGIATADIPYAALTSDGPISVELTFTYQTNDYVQTKLLNVVTPYLDIWDLRGILSDTEMTDTEMWDVERAVRRIIDAHCRQNFSQTTKIVKVLSNGYDVLNLPERLETMTKLSVQGAPLYDTSVSFGTDSWGNAIWLGSSVYTVVGDGWYIRSASYTTYPDYFNNDYSYPNYPEGINVVTTNPITNPFNILTPFKAGMYYSVAGMWGYADVPDEVVEAAKLLVNDYACSEALYRDRYLKQIRAADWTLEYGGGAYTNTGNVRADQLLAPFVRNNWLVI